ncbi:MAG: NnrS family protein, partial [Duganella sp.]
LFALPGPLVALVATIAAVAHGARWWLWQPWLTRRLPLVWILHASYLWIVASLVLRAFTALDLLAPSLATHALTVGGIGGLTLGMMTRTARGHTGYPLVAGKIEVTAYALIQAAAVVRVLLPLAVPARYVDAVVLSAALWAGAFALYALKFGPMLWRPRIDGKPG